MLHFGSCIGTDKIEIFILFDFKVEISVEDETLAVDSSDLFGCEIEFDISEILWVFIQSDRVFVFLLLGWFFA